MRKGGGRALAEAEVAAAADADLAALLEPLAGLLGRVAQARWAPLLGPTQAVFSGTAAAVPASAARAMGALSLDGAPAGWVRAALQAGAGPGGKPQDHRVLAAWLEGCGAALGQLLRQRAEMQPVQAGERPESAAEAPDVPVLGFDLTCGRRTSCAWLWMEAGLLGRCLDALEAAGPEPAGEDAPVAAWDVRDLSAPPRPLPPPLGAAAIEVLLDVPLQVSVELGRTERQIREVLALVPGSVVELDRLAGDPVDVLINGRRIARGEVVVVDERFAVRLTEIVTPEERVAQLG